MCFYQKIKDSQLELRIGMESRWVAFHSANKWVPTSKSVKYLEFWTIFIKYDSLHSKLQFLMSFNSKLIIYNSIALANCIPIQNLKLTIHNSIANAIVSDCVSETRKNE